MSDSPSSEPGPGPRIDDIAERLRRDAAAGLSGEQPSRNRKKVIVGALVGAALVAGIVAVATRSNGASDGSGANAPENSVAATAAPATVPTSDAALATVASPETTEAPTSSQAASTSTTATSSPTVQSTAAATSTTTAPSTTVAPTTSAPATTTPGSGTQSAATADLVRWAVYQGGKLYLRGRVPDTATQNDLAAKAGAVIGKDNVFVEYTVDPAAPLPDQAPVFVNDTVLFGSGSSSFSGQYNSLLDLGVTLLKLYPSVEIIATGYTDDLGTEDYNLKLSQRRVDAIRNYVVSHGGDVARISGVAKGEADPVASNDTNEGRAANRRIEFTIIGLLDA